MAGLLALPTMCFAQGSRPDSGQTPSSNPGPTSAPIDPTKYTNVGWEEAYNKGRTGDQLRGNLTLAEGTLPWEPIPVIVTCEGNSSYSTKTNPQGIFVITRVEPVGSTTIIGTQKSLVTQLVGCAVSAVLPGFDPSKLMIINRDVRTNPNIGTITLKREEGAEYAAVSATTATAPKEARKMFEKARKEWLDNKPDRARRDLEKAVEIYRQFAEAWYQLGKIEQASKSPGAWNSFANTIAADPKFTLPYEQMAALSATSEKWKELIEETQQALERNPRGTLELWYYNALGNYQLKKLDVAEVSASKSLSMDPLHVQPATEQLLAMILVTKNEIPAALEHLRNCLTYFPPGPNDELVKRQIAQLEARGAAPTSVKDGPGGAAGKEQVEALNARAKPRLSEHPSAEVGKKRTANSQPTSLSKDSHWAPVDVEESAPAIEAGTGCDLEEVLPKVGRRIQEFVENVERFTATETLYQETIRGSGEVSGKENRSYDYTVSIKEIRPGMFGVEENLSRGSTSSNSPGGIITKGLPALLLIFHPNDSGSFSMRCEGLVSKKGQQLWQIYFRQRADKRNTTRAYNIAANRPSYLVEGAGVVYRGFLSNRQNGDGRDRCCT